MLNFFIYLDFWKKIRYIDSRCNRENVKMDSDFECGCTDCTESRLWESKVSQGLFLSDNELKNLHDRIRKIYQKPRLEEVLIDLDMSLSFIKEPDGFLKANYFLRLFCPVKYEVTKNLADIFNMANGRILFVD